MRKLIAAVGFLGAFAWLSSSCSGSGTGTCQHDSDCPAGDSCAQGVCVLAPATTGASSSTSGTTGGSTTVGTTGAAASGTASGGSSTGLGSSTGSATGSSTGTTGGSSSGASSSGSTSGGVDAGPSFYCKPCTQQSDCGPIGNVCYPLADGNSYCGVACSDAGMCTEAGADCVTLHDQNDQVLGTDCIPISNACPASDGGVPDGGASDGGADGGDVYCQPCPQNDCPGTAQCVAFDQGTGPPFCAPDCTTTPCTEAGAQCDALNNGTSVCVPTSELCPGGDPYCVPCAQNSDCGGNGAVCTTLDGTDSCAADCSTTLTCSETTADCEAIEDVNGNAAEGCVPDMGFCD